MSRIIYSIIIFNLLLLVYGDWVDPHDMDYIQAEKLSTSKDSDLYKSCESQTFAEKNNINYDVYLKRIINLIINSANLDKSEITYYGHIKINMPVQDYNFLTEFTNSNNIDMDMLRKLDAMLSEAFKKSFNDYLAESKDKVYSIIFSEATIHCISLIFVIGFIYLMFIYKFSLWYIFKYLLFICWIYDCFIKYIHLQEEFDRHNIQILGDKCDLTNQSWGDTFRYMFGYSQCERKILSPFVVLEEQCKHIIGPLQFLGTGMGKFGRELFVNLPWGLNIVLMPLMLVFIGVIACIGFSFLADVPIKINVLHILQLQFGDKSKKYSGNILTENTLNRVLDAVSQKSAIAGTTIKESPILEEVKPSKLSGDKGDIISKDKEIGLIAQNKAPLKEQRAIKSSISLKTNPDEYLDQTCEIKNPNRIEEIKDSQKIPSASEDISDCMDNVTQIEDSGDISKTQNPVEAKVSGSGDAN